MLILALLSLLQAEPLPTVFGLQLGAPVTLPECELGPGGRYSSTQSQTCVRKPGVEDPEDPTYGIIVFDTATMPEIAGFNWIPIRVSDGRLERLTAQTLKYTVADQIIVELTKKFGEPTSRRAESVSVDGVPFPSVRVTWARPGYSVEYESVNNHDIDHGVLTVETEKSRLLREKKEQAKESQRTPL